jgi:hypothetical protein
MRARLTVALASGLILIGTAAGAVAETRSRGSIISISPQQIVVDSWSGEAMTFAITADTRYAAEKPVALAAIQPGSYIGSAAVPATGGVLRALEVTVFPPNMNGVGEGHYAWDLAPDSSMTNGTVGDLKQESGDLLTVTYNGGEQKILVPPDTPIVSVGPGSFTDLQPGVKVIVFSDAHDPQAADRILYGENGMTPPQ